MKVFQPTAVEKGTDKVIQAFSSYLELEEAKDFWKVNSLIIAKAILPNANLDEMYDETVYEFKCDHVNFSEGCKICDAWLAATIKKGE